MQASQARLTCRFSFRPVPRKEDCSQPNSPLSSTSECFRGYLQVRSRLATVDLRRLVSRKLQLRSLATYERRNRELIDITKKPTRTTTTEDTFRRSKSGGGWGGGGVLESQQSAIILSFLRSQEARHQNEEMKKKKEQEERKARAMAEVKTNEQTSKQTDKTQPLSFESSHLEPPPQLKKHRALTTGTYTRVKSASTRY